jgi:hypothetical protein
VLPLLHQAALPIEWDDFALDGFVFRSQMSVFNQLKLHPGVEPSRNKSPSDIDGVGSPTAGRFISAYEWVLHVLLNGIT